MNELMDGPMSTPNASFHMISRSFYAILAKENTYITGNQGLDLSFEPLSELVLFQEHHLRKV
jgi:hypothetical protein